MKFCPKSLEECQDIQHPTHCLGADRSPDPSPKGPHQDLLPLDRLAVNNLLLERAPKGVSVLDCATLADAIVSRFGSRAGTRSETTLEHEQQFADDQRAFAEIARICLAHGAETDDGTAVSHVRNLAKESERNARIVAAVKRVLTWARDIHVRSICAEDGCWLCADLDALASRVAPLPNGEPAPSEEQRLPKGACPKCGGLAACWCGMPNAESPPAQSKTLPENHDITVGEWDCTCGVDGYGWSAMYAHAERHRLSLGNVVPQSGVEPESVMELAEKLADAAALEAADQIEGQHRGDWTVDDTEHHRQRIEEARQALRAALSVTPRDQGGTTK